MKKLIVTLIALTLVLCGCKESPEGLWANAVYTENVTVGEGATEFTLKVTAQEKTVTITVKTDEKILGDALQKLELIEGEEGPYGVYIKSVNGMTVDYDTHGLYWAVYVGGEAASTGVDGIEITNGWEYELKAQK